MLLPGDADDDLIQVPFVATVRRPPTDAVGEFPAEFEAPLPDREKVLSSTGGRGFESTSLQRRVHCEPDFRGHTRHAAPATGNSRVASGEESGCRFVPLFSLCLS